ncbi:hypothetical protein PR048_006685 [Dryococelus australis]|uniref:Uncharacterized protein n=1 Tax=Dryococelus australis TaxID=614101 RepID=A0ABQ9IBL8_9NEOP|nr:hypothetical protein PR048_006685 [Dryococelus australis]
MRLKVIVRAVLSPTQSWPFWGAKGKIPGNYNRWKNIYKRKTGNFTAGGAASPFSADCRPADGQAGQHLCRPIGRGDGGGETAQVALVEGKDKRAPVFPARIRATLSPKECRAWRVEGKGSRQLQITVPCWWQQPGVIHTNLVVTLCADIFVAIAGELQWMHGENTKENILLFAIRSFFLRQFTSMCRNERARETEDLRENPTTSDIVRRDSHMRKSGSKPARTGVKTRATEILMIKLIVSSKCPKCPGGVAMKTTRIPPRRTGFDCRRDLLSFWMSETWRTRLVCRRSRAREALGSNPRGSSTWGSEVRKLESNKGDIGSCIKRVIVATALNSWRSVRIVLHNRAGDSRLLSYAESGRYKYGMSANCLPTVSKILWIGTDKTLNGYLTVGGSVVAGCLQNSEPATTGCSHYAGTATTGRVRDANLRTSSPQPSMLAYTPRSAVMESEGLAVFSIVKFFTHRAIDPISGTYYIRADAANGKEHKSYTSLGLVPCAHATHDGLTLDEGRGWPSIKFEACSKRALNVFSAVGNFSTSTEIFQFFCISEILTHRAYNSRRTKWFIIWDHFLREMDKWDFFRGAGEMGDPQENLPTNSIVRQDSRVRTSGVTQPGIEPGSPWWEANRLTAQPPRPPSAILRSKQFFQRFFGTLRRLVGKKKNFEAIKKANDLVDNMASIPGYDAYQHGGLLRPTWPPPHDFDVMADNFDLRCQMPYPKTERALCLIGYPVLRNVPYWSGCRLVNKLPEIVIISSDSLPAINAAQYSKRVRCIGNQSMVQRCRSSASVLPQAAKPQLRHWLCDCDSKKHSALFFRCKILKNPTRVNLDRPCETTLERIAHVSQWPKLDEHTTPWILVCWREITQNSHVPANRTAVRGNTETNRTGVNAMVRNLVRDLPRKIGRVLVPNLVRNLAIQRGKCHDGCNTRSAMVDLAQAFTESG